MQHDDVIWQSLSTSFCSFKVKTKTQDFCRNKYNVSGVCSRTACPLANSRYATVLEKEGEIYLYMKVVERAHSPRRLWERVKLPRNYAKALEEVSEHLQYWPKFLQHKCKQRLTKIHQFLIRMRRLSLKVKPKLIGIKKKIDRREKVREAKALKAANIGSSIKEELLARLQQGTYGDIYNFPQQEYEDVLDSNDFEVEEEDEDVFGQVEFVEEYDDDIMSDEDIEESYEKLEGSSSDEDILDEQRKAGKPSSKPIIEIEYEREDQMESVPQFS